MKILITNKKIRIRLTSKEVVQLAARRVITLEENPLSTEFAVSVFKDHEANNHKRIFLAESSGSVRVKLSVQAVDEAMKTQPFQVIDNEVPMAVGSFVTVCVEADLPPKRKI